MSSASDLQRLQNSIDMNITKINNNTSDIEKFVNDIGTAQDSPALRERYHRLQNDTKMLIEQTNSALTQLKNFKAVGEADQRKKKTLVDDLPKRYASAITRFQTVQRSGVQRERSSLDRARGVSIHSDGIHDSPFSSDRTTVGYQSQQAVAMEQNVDMNKLEERDRQLKELERNIVEVNELFKDVAQLVHEQGGIIDSIEQHVAAADTQVYVGNKALVKARVYQTSARRKKIIIVIVCIIVLIVVGLVLFLVLRSKL